ncbi:hypothetical protein D7V93_23265 [Corallococcus llansteffanensis]|uniref:CHAT domain-containing protein n=2 Tax=Corallococcus llansteffanensis TaxID=2316731 RepID=A0A3A8PG35_9BACT|nr:hypothetical protein D7V93_23265 [Corallococcus llansteffanensis]
MDDVKAARWMRTEFRKEAVDESDRPRYLLLLGDLDGLSLELQQVLSTNAFVGRLVFPSADGYEAYCSKVLKWESSPYQGQVRPRALLYTSKDGTSATDLAYDVLMGPSFETLQARQPKDFPEAELQEIIDEKGASTQQWLSNVSQSEPRVMLTLSHGLGPGWKTREQQRRLQGAFVLPDKSLLTGEELVSRPFLPGGIWLFLACYGAGTPGRSSYAPWLQQLRDVDRDAARVLEEGMPGEGALPFVAALPQAVLSNPSGPLAVIGHMDLAWVSTFSDQGRLAHSRFLGILRALLQGRRVGNALHTLLRIHSESLVELTALLNQDELARAMGRTSSVDLKVKARLWLLCQDLVNYVLLGDPAVRVPGNAINGE